MRDEDHKATAPQRSRSEAFRRGWILLAVLATLGSVLAVRSIRDGDTKDQASGSGKPEPTLVGPTTTSSDQRTELVARLEEVLSKREIAYKKRDPEILREIYTVDCPCLKSDSNAIRELQTENYKWIGGETSIKVRRLERVTDRMWLLVADFTSEPLRIETETGRTVRVEPRGSDLFQFVLAMPTGSNQWLLGRATSYKRD